MIALNGTRFLNGVTFGNGDTDRHINRVLGLHHTGSGLQQKRDGMTFQHGGHGCIGVGSVLGGFGIHGPGPKPQPGGDHHFGGGFGGGPKGPKGGMSESMGLFPDQPMGLIFGDPEAAAAHHYSLAAIPIGGGWTLSIVALLMALCLLAVLASASYRTVAVRCSG